MSTRLTPTDRLILIALRFHPGISADRLTELMGTRTGKDLRASLRTMILAGINTEETDVVAERYRVTEVPNGL